MNSQDQGQFFIMLVLVLGYFSKIKIGCDYEHMKIIYTFDFTQNPGSSAYTQHWVLYPWDELIISISQVHEVGKPLH